MFELILCLHLTADFATRLKKKTENTQLQKARFIKVIELKLTEVELL